jgi:murein DD-endopeptidase MepM/ murein hydrolase activator NlpD
MASSAPQASPTTNVASVPTARVQSQALPPVQAGAVAPIRTAVAPAAPVTSSAGGWSVAGGTRITIGSNDSLPAVSQRYGVPMSAILSANGLSSPSQVTAGRQIVIPVYNASGQPVAAAEKPIPGRPAGQTKFRLVQAEKPIAEKSEPGKTHVRPGQLKAAEKSDKVTTVVKVASAAPVAPAPRLVPPRPAEAPKIAARIEPQPIRQSVQPVRPAPPSQPEVARAPAPEPDQTASLPGPAAEFRWPARGRVIAGFGANGGNEGINIAVPEGTPVKAAEAGTVTYAGSEVKGYGNLVLIRHDNGYVSAYAHNGDLNVKRGEKVKRGQVIATSGQTGNVTSPQLHFELRKGQSPVDPTQYLSN